MERGEQQIQRAVFQHLAIRGAPNLFAFHPPAGGFRRKSEAAIFKGVGVKAGVPDVVLIHGGRPYFLELKIEGGRLSQKQQETMAALEGAGATVAVVYGLSAALAWLEGHGLLLGRAA